MTDLKDRIKWSQDLRDHPASQDTVNINSVILGNQIAIMSALVELLDEMNKPTYGKC